MKKLLLLSLTAFTFIACGEDTTITTNTQDEKTILCVDVLNADTIKGIFKDSHEIIITSESKKYCAYKFKLESEVFYTHLSIGGIKFANVAMLEQSVNRLSSTVTKDNKLLQGVGEKAYSTSIAGGQISAFSDGNLIHVAVTGNKFDVEKSKLLANDIFKRMK